MKPLLITTLLAVFAPVASANDVIDSHQKTFRAPHGVRRTVHRAISRLRHRVDHVRSRRVRVPVRHETVRRRVYIPGAIRRVWHPARYAIRHDDHGNSYRVLVRHGRWDTSRTHGRYEWRAERVRRGGHYEAADLHRRRVDRHRRNRR